MKYIGLDLGSKTCGIAISDAFGYLARTYDTLRFKEDDYDTCCNQIVEIVKKEKVECIVLGMPKHMNGDIGIRGKISEDFKEKLLLNLDINVILWDERLTSVAVNKTMIEANMRREDRKKKKDELAAVVILQGYLDFKK